ncbi:hypothetical protein H0266_07345 [Halobacillus locisalis]|uniref:Uncharacterized protein n=1 Tax=Halobacillus locisalis TaxID=220753 RepID=A0A838CSG6_9BACI|nr:hypothetical protein [Halobacillus locisalis]MBA2174705.1 hypothetical protein [Halobacillus locisalis]
MKKQNQMLIILGTIGVCNLIAALILFVATPDPMAPLVLMASGILLIVGGYADRKERIKRNQQKKS